MQGCECAYCVVAIRGGELARKIVHVRAHGHVISFRGGERKRKPVYFVHTGFQSKNFKACSGRSGDVQSGYCMVKIEQYRPRLTMKLTFQDALYEFFRLACLSLMWSISHTAIVHEGSDLCRTARTQLARYAIGELANAECVLIHESCLHLVSRCRLT